jgi:hypothetical protein
MRLIQAYVDYCIMSSYAGYGNKLTKFVDQLGWNANMTLSHYSMLWDKNLYFIYSGFVFYCVVDDSPSTYSNTETGEFFFTCDLAQLFRKITFQSKCSTFQCHWL